MSKTISELICVSLVGASLASGCALVKGHELRGCPNLERVQNGFGLEGELFLFQYWPFSSMFLGGSYFFVRSHSRDLPCETDQP